MTQIPAGSEPSKKSNAVIIIIVLIVFGLVFGGVGYYRYKAGRASSGWPVVRGKINYARVQSRRTNNRTDYTASIRYSYSINGTSYTGNEITASDKNFKTRSRADAALRPYPVGSEVDVYYNPSKPQQSVLETGLPMNVFLLMGVGVFCFLLAVLVIMSLFKKGMQPGG